MAWVTGFDVSHWQVPSMDLARQRVAAGDRFAIIKSTDGTATDKAAAAHLDNFTQVGLACGAYVFYRSQQNAVTQARRLLEATKGRHLPFGLWLDYEDGSGRDNADDLLSFLTTLDDGFPGTVGIYTGPSWWTATIGDDRRFARFPLWLARYPNAYKDGTVPPEGTSTKTPLPWPTWSVWQYSDSSGHLDRNVCTQAVFDAITGHQEPTPQPKGWLDMLSDQKQQELYDAVMRLDKALGHSGQEVRQTIAEIDKRTEDLASGDRPEKAPRWYRPNHDKAAADALGPKG